MRINIDKIMAKTNDPILYREGLKEKILQVSLREFMKHGIRAVKMDDIASLLTISKRTLYEVYSNKEDLLLDCIKQMSEQVDAHMQAFSARQERNVVEIVMEFYHAQMNLFSGVTPVFLTDLKRYAKLRDYMAERHHTKESQRKDFFKKGVADGYFLADFDYDIVARICEASLDHALRTHMYHRYQLKHIFRNIILLFIRGICTEKGIAEIERLQETETA